MLLHRIALSSAFVIAFATEYLTFDTAQGQGNCLRANSSAQRISGNLMKRGKDFILRVDGAVCLRGSDPEDNKDNVTTVHLYSNSASIERQLARAVGTYFEVVGRPFGALTQHHRAPIVMEVREVVRL